MNPGVRIRGKMKFGHASGVARNLSLLTDGNSFVAMIARKLITVKGGALCHHPG
jgi:hypothetical protein